MMKKFLVIAVALMVVKFAHGQHNRQVTVFTGTAFQGYREVWANPQMGECWKLSEAVTFDASSMIVQGSIRVKASENNDCTGISHVYPEGAYPDLAPHDDFYQSLSLVHA